MGAPWATCTVENCAGIRLPGRFLCLAHADERSRAVALGRITGNAEVDLRGLSLDNGLLTRVLRALPRDEQDRPLWNTLKLDGATIEPGPPLDLAGHEFTTRTSWRCAWFLRPVILRNAQLTRADFRDADFDEHLDAEGVTFVGCPRFDDTRFHGGVTFDDAWFDSGFDMRRASASEVLLANATVHTVADVSLTRFGTLDLSGGRVFGDLIADGAHIARVVLTGTEIDGVVRDAGAAVSTWEPTFTAAADIEGPALTASGVGVREVGLWRAELLGDARPQDYRWVTIEEWVGHSELADGEVGYHGGIIGLQIAPWPGVDATGKPLFDESAIQIVAVQADALTAALRDLLGDAFTPLHVGDVYAMRWEREPTQPGSGGPLDEAALRALGIVHATDTTGQAREAAKAAFWSVHVPTLDAESDAQLINAMTATDEDLP
ncbi:MAG: pentapeptide repeat-containing protein [Haloechinothrix sp.]